MTRNRSLIVWFRHLKLAHKLILIHCLLIVFPLIGMGLYTFSSFQKTMEKNVGAYQLQTVNQVALNIDTYLNELNRLTLSPYSYPEIMSFIGSAREAGQPLTLKEIETLNNFISKIFINDRIDIMGVSLYGERGASYVVLPESQYMTTYKLDDNAEWLKQAKGQYGQSTFIATHEVQAASGMKYRVFSIARELRSFDTGRSLGYIVIDIDPASVRKILAQAEAGEEASLYMIDAEGNPVIHGERDEIVRTGLLRGSGVMNAKNERGDDMQIAYVTSEVSGWTTVSAVSVNSLMKDGVRVRNSIAFAMLVFIGLAMVFSVFIAYRITNPLRSLSRMMYQVERGDLKVAFPVRSRDEVGRLGNAFNKMVSKLSELGYLLFETEIREKDAQIAALQSKINPHFLYNTLGSISMFAELEGNKEIVTMSNNLSRLLRYSLSSNKETVTLQDELQHVNGYMSIQKIRYEDRIRFEQDIDPSVLGCRVIPLMIQPIVENSLNHGLDKGVGNGLIRITGSEANGVLTIAIQDDGIGLSESELAELRNRLRHSKELGGKSGNGLLNVHRRIVLSYGEAYGIHVESMPYQGVKVILTMPVLREG